MNINKENHSQETWDFDTDINQTPINPQQDSKIKYWLFIPVILIIWKCLSYIYVIYNQLDFKANKDDYQIGFFLGQLAVALIFIGFLCYFLYSFIKRKKWAWWLFLVLSLIISVSFIINLITNQFHFFYDSNQSFFYIQYYIEKLLFIVSIPLLLSSGVRSIFKIHRKSIKP